MDRAYVVPSREEMERGLAEFARRASVAVRYGCAWEGTRRAEDGRLVLTTSDGEYRAQAVVFAIGVTTPWLSPIPGIDTVPHYVDTRAPADYRGRRVFVIGKRNSGFEIADGLLPWAQQVILGSPRPVQTAVIAQATVRVRYLQPYEDATLGRRHLRAGPGGRAHRTNASAAGACSATARLRPGPIELEVDDAIAATGFSTPLLDLDELGVRTVSQGRVPALTPFWESEPGSAIYFAGNATQGAPGLRKHGVGAASPAVHGFRYNASDHGPPPRRGSPRRPCSRGARRGRPGPLPPGGADDRAGALGPEVLSRACRERRRRERDRAAGTLPRRRPARRGRGCGRDGRCGRDLSGRLSAAWRRDRRAPPASARC